MNYVSFKTWSNSVILKTEAYLKILEFLDSVQWICLLSECLCTANPLLKWEGFLDKCKQSLKILSLGSQVSLSQRKGHPVFSLHGAMMHTCFKHEPWEQLHLTWRVRECPFCCFRMLTKRNDHTNQNLRQSLEIFWRWALKEIFLSVPPALDISLMSCGQWWW